jgi:hypothetical protein
MLARNAEGQANLERTALFLHAQTMSTIPEKQRPHANTACSVRLPWRVFAIVYDAVPG